MKALLLLVLCFAAVAHATLKLPPAARRLEDRLEAGRCAAVTLVYSDDEFVLGAATLGYSLKDTNTRMRMVAMVTDAVGQESRQMLVNAGWRLHDARAVPNPNPEYFTRLEYIFTKLQIYTLTEYERVVYLDADTLVNENVDELCSCNAYHCSVVRNTFFNSGVIVAIPSNPIYLDMMEKYTTMHSYTGGDQGFLNNYFWNPEECPFFDPQQKLESLVATDVTHLRCQRLPGYYNGDVGVYITRGDRWQFDPDEERQQPKITHYTLSIFKPWSWPTYIVIKDSWNWFRVFEKQLVHSSDSSLVLFFTSFFSILGACYVVPRLPLYRLRALFGVLMMNRMGRAIFGQLQHLLVLAVAFYHSQLIFVDPTILMLQFFFWYYLLFMVFCVVMWKKYWEAAAGTQVTFDRVSVNVHKILTCVSLGVVMLVVWSDALLIYGRAALMIAWLFGVVGVGHTVFYQILPLSGSSLPK